MEIRNCVFIVVIIIHDVLGGTTLGGIPSRQEQVTVLEDVQEIFNQGKNVVFEEQKFTLKSVIADSEKMVKRAKDNLLNIEDLALTKLIYKKTANSVQNDEESQKIIQKTIEEGFALLDQCTETISKEIKVNSNQVSDVASAGSSQAQVVIDTLFNCTKKPALQQISCYRRVMLNDVSPVKVVILNTMESHKKGHLKSIEIRNFANDCVDTITQTCHEKILNILRNNVQ